MRASSQHPNSAGFGLVALVLSLFILACVVVLVVREVRAVNDRSKSMALVSELLWFEQAFQMHAHDKRGVAPASSLPGQIPAGMERILSGSRWSKGSPFGGHYTWISPCPEAWLPTGRSAAGTPLGAIALTAFAPDAPLSLEPIHFAATHEELERSSHPKGRFGVGFNGWPVLIVYPSP